MLCLRACDSLIQPTRWGLSTREGLPFCVRFSLAPLVFVVPCLWIVGAIFVESLRDVAYLLCMVATWITTSSLFCCPLFPFRPAPRFSPTIVRFLLPIGGVILFLLTSKRTVYVIHKVCATDSQSYSALPITVWAFNALCLLLVFFLVFKSLLEDLSEGIKKKLLRVDGLESDETHPFYDYTSLELNKLMQEISGLTDLPASVTLCVVSFMDLNVCTKVQILPPIREVEKSESEIGSVLRVRLITANTANFKDGPHLAEEEEHLLHQENQIPVYSVPRMMYEWRAANTRGNVFNYRTQVDLKCTFFCLVLFKCMFHYRRPRANLTLVISMCSSALIGLLLIPWFSC
jgi:hypothetical protein